MVGLAKPDRGGGDDEKAGYRGRYKPGQAQAPDRGFGDVSRSRVQPGCYIGPNGVGELSDVFRSFVISLVVLQGFPCLVVEIVQMEMKFS